MKKKATARERREAEERKRKGAFRQEASPSSRSVDSAPVPAAPARPAAVRPASAPSRSTEEEAREFLEALERFDIPVDKREGGPRGGTSGRKNGASGGIARLLIKQDMPLVEEALERMNIGLQEMRAGRVRAVKVIHGYGSTGRGGAIRPAVRKELAALERRKFIRGYIPGENFGPMDAASRKLAEQEKGITRDPDYGRMNEGITIVFF